MLGVLPMFHSFGLTYTLWFPLVTASRRCFIPIRRMRRRSASGREHRPTLFLSTPTFCLSYLRKCTPEQFSAYASCWWERKNCGRPGAMRSREVRDRAAGRVWMHGNGPGGFGELCERASTGKRGTNAAERRGACGDPETGSPVAAGETGLLLVNGPSRMLGYFGEPARDGGIVGGRLYVTGDLARMDALGFLHIVDRLSRSARSRVRWCRI